MVELFRSPVVVLDTETTGFGPEAVVIELGAVVLDRRGVEVDRFESFVALPPEAPWSDAAEAVHHISRDRLVGAPDAAEVERALTAWLDQHAHAVGQDARHPWVTAFNVDFDRRLCEQSGLRSLRWLGVQHCIMRRAMGPMGAAGALKPRRDGGFRWPGLSAAMDFFSLRFDGPAHRALTDARGAADVLREVRRWEVSGG